MTAEEEMRQENESLRERVRWQQEKIDWLEERLVLFQQQETLREELQKQVELLKDQVQALQDQLKKDSHNSHLPPSSDRFHRQPKSLRQQSGKQAGGQPGHPGSTLMLSPTPDTVIVHAVEQCMHCQGDLREVESLRVERRQVIELPVKRVLVIEHQAQQKSCPTCQQISSAAFPENVSAPVQYGAAFGAVGVYLVHQQLLPYERACEVMQERHGPKYEREDAASTGAALCRGALPGRGADQSRPRARAGGRAAPG